MNCGNCGFGNGDAARFCVRCGASLAAPAPAGFQAAPLHAQPGAPPFGAPAHPHPPPYAGPTQRGMISRPQPRQAQGEPVLAAFLSVIVPGLGQLYNSDTKKGLVFFGAAVVGIFFLGLGWLAMMIWGGIDAYQVASGTGRRWT